MTCSIYLPSMSSERLALSEMASAASALRNPPFSFGHSTRGIRRRMAHGAEVPPDRVRSNCGSELSGSLRGSWLALIALMPTLGGRLIESIRSRIPICGNAVEPTTSVLTRPRVERFGFFMCFIDPTDYRLQKCAADIGPPLESAPISERLDSRGANRRPMP